MVLNSLVRRALKQTQKRSSICSPNSFDSTLLNPSLEALGLTSNDFHDLPASSIDDLVSHPKLRCIYLNGNHRLGCSFHSSTPCAIHCLLSQACLAAPSSHFTLRDLRFSFVGLTAECCGPALERLLSLGSRGFRTLHLNYNPSLLPHARTLLRVIWKDNFYIQKFFFDNIGDLEWEDGEEGLPGRCGDTLQLALDRNRRIAREIEEAAVKILNVGRVIFFGAFCSIIFSCVGPAQPLPTTGSPARATADGAVVRLPWCSVRPSALICHSIGDKCSHLHISA